VGKNKPFFVAKIRYITYEGHFLFDQVSRGTRGPSVNYKFLCFLGKEIFLFFLHPTFSGIPGADEILCNS
jgi:hypothetical protein